MIEISGGPIPRFGCDSPEVLAAVVPLLIRFRQVEQVVDGDGRTVVVYRADEGECA